MNNFMNCKVSGETKQQVFSFKKGQCVPPWVIRLENLDGSECSGDGTVEFLVNGKLFINNSGDLFTYFPRPRDRKAILIMVRNAHHFKVAGVMNFAKNCKSAMKNFKLKNTVKAMPIPYKDPR